MTQGEFEKLLPDFLAGELDAGGVAAVEAYLRTAPDQAALVAELAALQQEVRRGAPSVADAALQTRSLHAPSGPLRTGWRIAVALRYAAVVLIAFGAGYWMRGGAAIAPPGAPPDARQPTVDRVVQASDGAVNPRVAKNFQRAASTYPQANSLAWAALSIAK